jgi:hypothetical protein
MCHFIPMCLVFSLTKAFWEYAMALWLSSRMVVVSVFVLPDGVEDLPHKLAEVESLLGGVSRKAVLGFTSGLGHTCLFLDL